MAESKNNTTQYATFKRLNKYNENNENNEKGDLYLMKLVVDTSSSMDSYGTNQYYSVKEFLDHKKKENSDYKTLFSFTTFSSLSKNHNDWCEFDDINYSVDDLKKILNPNGSTRLIDTAYEELLDMEEMINENKEKYNSVIGMFALQTDGYDNQSILYNNEDLKRKIKELEEKGVISIFLASNQDAIKTGDSYGFSKENSLKLSSTNSAEAYRSLSQAASEYMEYNTNSEENEKNTFNPFTDKDRTNCL